MSLGLGCDLLPVWGFLSGQLMWAVGYGGPLVSGECHYESPTTPQQSPLSNETKKTLMTNQIHLRRCKGNNRIFDIRFVLIKIWELQCFFLIVLYEMLKVLSYRPGVFCAVPVGPFCCGPCWLCWLNWCRWWRTTGHHLLLSAGSSCTRWEAARRPLFSPSYTPS